MQKQKSIESFSMTFHFVVSFAKELYFSNTHLEGKEAIFLETNENAPFSAKNVFGGRTYSS